jgi:hypothetical protein
VLARNITGVGDNGQIIYQHSRLMAAAERIEIDLLMAMPPHEREARFRSAPGCNGDSLLGPPDDQQHDVQLGRWLAPADTHFLDTSISTHFAAGRNQSMASQQRKGHFPECSPGDCARGESTQISDRTDASWKCEAD